MGKQIVLYHTVECEPAGTWMNLKSIILSEKSEPPKTTVCPIPFI